MTTETPTPQPDEQPTPEEQRLMQIDGFAHFIGATVKSVAAEHKMPLNTAHAVVKTALEYEVNIRALNQQRQAQAPMPFLGSADAPEAEEEN